MSLTNILISLLSLFITFGNYTNKILIKDTLIIESLTLSKEELIQTITTNYNIPSNYNNIEIYTNYLNSPDYNKIYSVDLIIYYNQDVVDYNLKIQTVVPKTNDKKQNNTLVLVLISMILILCFIYYKRSN